MAGPAVCLFPGQGSQRVGMGRDLVESFPVARRTFEEADERLDVPLSRLCFDGPEAVLQLTENAQPAILTVSVCVYRVLLETTRLSPAAVCGRWRRLSVTALTATMKLDPDIDSAAISGRSTRPKAGSNTPAAIGRAIAL